MALLEIDHVSRSFGETKALTDCTLHAEEGSVHSILGENGSGKSTLVKILSGVLPPDGGSVHIGGESVGRFTPGSLRSRGVATVFQEILDAPNRTVLSNVFLGFDPMRSRRITLRRDRRDAASAVLSRVTESRIPLDSLCEELPLPARQLVTIARALVSEPRVLVLDEATSALGSGDRSALFDEIRRIVDRGCLVIFITHRMDEILELANKVTVLRNGQSVTTVSTSETDVHTLLELMSPRMQSAWEGETHA